MPERGLMTKRYSILMPIAGDVSAEVTADSEEEALEKFYGNWYRAVKTREHEAGDDRYCVESLEAYEKLHEGNVVHVESAWEMEIEEVTDDVDH